MTLYLSPDLTPDEIRKASKAGIVGMCYILIYLLGIPTLNAKVSSPTLVELQQTRKAVLSPTRHITLFLKRCKKWTWSSTFMEKYPLMRPPFVILDLLVTQTMIFIPKW